MASSCYNPESLLRSYPESNPFLLDPPLFNLIPHDLELEQFDTPELKDAALAVANRTAVNVFLT